MLGNPLAAKQSVGMNSTNASRKFSSPGDWQAMMDRRHAHGGPVIPYGTPRANYQYLVDLGTPLKWEERNPAYASAPNRNGWTANGPDNMTGFSGSLAWERPFASAGKAYNGVKPGGATGVAGTSARPTGASSYTAMPQTAMPQGGVGQIQTSITPKPIYQPWMTTTAVNTAQAKADQASNAPYLMKMFDRPGVSRSDAHFAAIAPIVAENQINAANARATIPFEDTVANERNLFLGQVARENEALNLGNLLARIAEAQQQSQFGQMNRFSNLLSGLVG